MTSTRCHRVRVHSEMENNDMINKIARYLQRCVDVEALCITTTRLHWVVC